MNPQFYPQKTNFKSERLFVNQKILTIKLLVFLFISLFTVKVNAQTIGAVTVLGAPACQGSALSVSFLVTNGTGSVNHFTPSTKYTIYYSTGTSFSPLTTFSSSTVPSGDGGTATITESIIVPGAAPGGSYKVSVGSTLPTFIGSGGVNASAAFTIHGGPGPQATVTKVFASSCNGGTDGSINVTPSGGTSPYTYSWTGVGSFAATTQNVAGLALGDYNVVVKDQNLCAYSLTGISIKQAPAVQAGVSRTIPTCAGNDGALNVFRVGGVFDGVTPTQYKIDGTVTVPYQNNGSFTGLTAGDYIVTVKDSKGCTGTALVTLPADNRPAPTAGVLQKILPSCGQANGSISAFRIGGVADATHSVQYKLDGDATVPYQTSNVFSGLAAGNYFVTVKDSRGCTGITAVSLPADARPAPSAGIQKADPGCAGNDGSISVFRIAGVSDGKTPVQYKLDGAATIPYQSSGVFSGLSAGSYTVTVKDSRGCTGTSTVVLSQVPLTFTSNGYNTNVSSCGSGSDGATVVTVNGGISPYHFILNGVEQGVTSLKTFGIGNLQANIAYNIMVTDSRGCSISKSVTLSQVSSITSLVGYTGKPTCMGGSDGFITAWQSGGVPGYMYSKDGGATYQGSYRFLDLTAGTYNVVVKDSKGCVGTTVPVTIADGIGNCPMARVGDFNSNNTTANREGNTNNYSALSKSALNTSLSIQSYPNPFTSEFTLNVEGNNTDKVSLIVTDVLGRRWYQAQGNANQQYKLGSTLRSGIYFVQVMQGNNVQTIKIVKE